MSTATTLAWSPYQTALFDFVEKGQGSAIVNAVAGSGKTTTIVEAARRLDPFTAALFVAFNKRVADALAVRLPASVPAMTLNALGYRAWNRFAEKRVEIDAYKTSFLVRDMSANTQKDFVAGVKKMVDMAKLSGLVPNGAEQFGNLTGLVDDSEENWQAIIDEFEIHNIDEKQAIPMARRVLLQSIRTAYNSMDFNDQLYLPVIFGAPFNKFDLLFVDEAQDVNGIQLEMIARSIHAAGRIIAVGDPNQAIYGFRGAGKNSMEEMRDRFIAQEFPLSVCYRCPRTVVSAAQRIVPRIESFDGAEEGEIHNLGLNWHANMLKNSDVILCRNNAPLVDLAFKLIRQGKACKVLGRDIGNGLIGLVRKMKAVSVEDLGVKLADYVSKEADKLRRLRKEDQIERLLDRQATLRVFISKFQPNAPAEDVITSIQNMFADDAGGLLTLSTVHKAKGLEWDSVFILNVDLIPSKWARDGWQVEQEYNLLYVAITRAKKQLFYISLGGEV